MSSMASGGFGEIDWAVLGGYFLVLIATGVVFTRSQNSTDDYFRASGKVPVFAAAISFLATALSAATFVGGPQQSFTGDLTYLSSNIGSIIAIIIVAVFFVPAFYRNKVSTVYGLLHKRFGAPASTAASVAFLVGRVFASGARIYIAALPASLIMFGDIIWQHQLVAIAGLTMVGIVYTYAGGIRTVIFTDVIQTFIFVGAALVALVMLLHQIPVGISEIIDILRHPGEGMASKLTIMPLGFKGFGPEHTYTFLSAVFGFTLLTLGSYGTDQDMAQRLLTLKDARKGKQSAVWGILIGLPVTFLFMVIGLLLFIFYSRPDVMGAMVPGYAVEGSRKIFLSYILHEAPPGITGLMMAGLFAAGLSSLNSAINSMSSSFVNDLYKRWKPARSEAHYLKVGRSGVAIIGVILGMFAVFSVFWQEARPETTLINFALLVMVFAYSGLVAVFLTALFTKRGNNATVIAAIATGFLSVVVMQTWFAKDIAFPWQMFVATTLAFVVCVSGKRGASSGEV